MFLKACRIFIAIVCVAALLALYMVALASSAPRLRKLHISVAAWPSDAKPLRIVLLSDLHVSSPGDSPSRLSDTVARVNALRPDLVLIAGDFMATGIGAARSYSPTETVAPLARLRPRLGVYAVLGNHDYNEQLAVESALDGLGVRLLDNDAERIGPLTLIGISDEYSRHANVKEASSAWFHIGGIPIVLTHSPDVIPSLPRGMNVVLAGHTHCGQISFPLIGAPITQSRFGQRYACGIVKEGNRVSLITAGLGVSTFPVRFGAPPDFWEIDVGR